MFSALVSVHELKNEVYYCVTRLFRYIDKERAIFMSHAVISVNRLKTRYIHLWRACFGSWIKERLIFMCSALVLVHGFKNELYLCVVHLFRLLD